MDHIPQPRVDFTQINEAITAVCPVVSIAVGRVDFAPEATAEQRALAQSIMDNWDWGRPERNSILLAKTYVSMKRYEREVGGIMVGEQLVTTQRDEHAHIEAKLSHAMLARKGDPEALFELSFTNGMYPYKPKGPHSPVMLTVEQMYRLGKCVRYAIQGVFAVEYQLHAMLDAGAPIDQVLAAADSPETWPAREFTWEWPT